MLTAGYFDLPDVTLTPVRSVLTDGSTVLFPARGDGLDTDDELDGEDGFHDDLATVPSGARMIISAVSLDDLIGPHDLLPDEPLLNPASPNGLEYGIVNGIADDGNSTVTGVPLLVKDGATFRSIDLPKRVDGSKISRVMYGMADDPRSVPVPAAGAVLLGTMMGLGVVGCLRSWRKA